MSHPSYSPNLTPSDFFLFPQIKSVLQGKCFADVVEVKQKTAEALQGIQIDELKNCLSSGKTILTDGLHQMESTREVTEVQTYKNKYTIFYK